MHCKSILPALILLFVATSGCTEEKIPPAANAALEQATSMELLSLHPDPRKAEGEEEKFHEWKILGKTVIDEEETLKPLIDRFRKGVNENEGIVAGCFNPRHGIRLTHDDKVHEFVICFECYQVKWYVDGESKAGFLITDSPAAAFNGVLRDADVPLPKNDDG